MMMMVMMMAIVVMVMTARGREATVALQTGQVLTLYFMSHVSVGPPGLNKLSALMVRSTFPWYVLQEFVCSLLRYVEQRNNE